MNVAAQSDGKVMNRKEGCALHSSRSCPGQSNFDLTLFSQIKKLRLLNDAYLCVKLVSPFMCVTGSFL
jgi:hypothetical protein